MTPRTPERYEKRARAEGEAGNHITAAHLLGHAHGIRQGVRMERERIVASLRREHPDEIERHAMADDIEAGRL